ALDEDVAALSMKLTADEQHRWRAAARTCRSSVRHASEIQVRSCVDCVDSFRADAKIVYEGSAEPLAQRKDRRRALIDPHLAASNCLDLGIVEHRGVAVA